MLKSFNTRHSTTQDTKEEQTTQRHDSLIPAKVHAQCFCLPPPARCRPPTPPWHTQQPHTHTRQLQQHSSSSTSASASAATRAQTGASLGRFRSAIPAPSAPSAAAMAAPTQWWEALGAEAGFTIANPDFTYHYDKVSCMRGAYFAHLVFCYLMFLSGIFAFVTRLIPALKWSHVWMGRAYIISMLWATATSLIIHNSGLPAATLISFIWVLGGLCIAWVLIKLHELRMDRAAARLVQQQIAAGDSAPAKDLARALATAKATLASNKTFVQRFFSLKAAHGIIMFISWINIAGRIFASDQSGDFTCHTYPVYKPLDTKHANASSAPMTLLPTHDPKYTRLPWARTGLVGWSLALLLGPLVGAALVGAGFSFFAARAASKRSKTSPSGVAAAAAQDKQLAAVEDGVLVAHGSHHAK